MDDVRAVVERSQALRPMPGTAGEVTVVLKGFEPARGHDLAKEERRPRLFYEAAVRRPAPAEDPALPCDRLTRADQTGGYAFDRRVLGGQALEVDATRELEATLHRGIDQRH